MMRFKFVGLAICLAVQSVQLGGCAGPAALESQTKQRDARLARMYFLRESRLVATTGTSAEIKVDGTTVGRAGELKIDNVNVASMSATELDRFRADKIGFIFQQFHLIPYLSAVENVMLAQYFHSMTDEAEARAALEKVGLGDRVSHLPSELSGGEQQRVCIARALINNPPILLADEPTGNLDAANQTIVAELLQDLHRNGHTIVMVTHDPEMAGLAQRKIALSHGKVFCHPVGGPMVTLRR